MNDLTEKEALYILRHRKKYKDNEIDMAINKIKRINSHRAEYIKRYKEKLKRSIPKRKIEDKIKAIIEEYKIKIKRARELEDQVINTPEEYKERMKLYDDITCLDIEYKTYKELLEDK